MLVVALATCLVPSYQVSSATLETNVEIYGFVAARANDTLTVDISNGSEMVVRLATDWKAFLGTVVGRNDVVSGNVVGVTAIVVGTSVEHGTIARDFWVAGPELSHDAAIQAMATFVPPAAPARPRMSETRPVIGTFKELRYGTIMIVETGQEELWIKLGPEATGYQIQPGERNTVVTGAHVLVNMAPEQHASGVLVIKDGSDPFGGTDAHSR